MTWVTVWGSRENRCQIPYHNSQAAPHDLSLPGAWVFQECPSYPT